MTNGNRAFWERTWGSVAPERLSACAAGVDAAEDAVTAFLREQGVRSVCDAGCGCGAYALKLARRGFSVSGFDLAAEAVSLTKKLLSEHGFPTGSFKQADIMSTGYADGAFDAAVARDVVDHMPLKQGVLAVRELLRIVRPGGFVLLTLDAADEEYESEEHTVSEDGDYRYTGGKWEGMTFHPFDVHEIGKLADGAAYRVLDSTGGGFTVALAGTGAGRG
ncbi:MAG: class I SAM-dependent methyltransferase [Oscillospiraceae bacterium]|nr:class I SAM-dependent methyltransferase [Oscillospiraceae bacterium]